MSAPSDDPVEQALTPLRELAALSQTGLAFTKDPYDRERYVRLREIVEELLRGPRAASPTFDPGVVLGNEKGYATRPRLTCGGRRFAMVASSW